MKPSCARSPCPGAPDPRRAIPGESLRPTSGCPSRFEAPRSESGSRQRSHRPLAAALALALVLLAAAAGACSDRPAPDAGAQPLPESALPSFDRARGLVKARSFEEALAVLVPLCAEHPRARDPHVLAGAALHELKRYAPAREHFEQVRELDPGHALARYYLAFECYYLGEPERARAEFEGYLAVAPDDGHGWYGLGLIALDSGELTQSESHFRRSIALHQAAGDRRREGSARARLADVLLLREEHAAARDELERATELDPDAYSAYHKLAHVLRLLGDEDGAARAERLHDEVKARVRPSGGAMIGGEGVGE
jgi:tetratricopeptide (TPR) repeat protein